MLRRARFGALLVVLAASAVGPPGVILSQGQVTQVAGVAAGQIYESKGVLWMKSSQFTAGFNESRGGALSSLVVGGAGVVNNWDDGRSIQTDFYDSTNHYDGCSGCSGTWGWNPVESGDTYFHGSQMKSKSISASQAYFVTESNEWVPDNKGGGPTTPVPSDLRVEKWLTFVAGFSDVLREHYRVTNIGTVSHQFGPVGFPAVFTNPAYNRLVYYGGTAPFTAGGVTTTAIASGSSAAHYYTSEMWQGLVDQNGNGVVVYVPGQASYVDAYSNSGNPTPGWAYNYMGTLSTAVMGPGKVLEGDVYILPGSYVAARATITALHAAVPTPHLFGPEASWDSPASGQVVAGTAFPVYGWAFDDVSPVSRVEIDVDGAAVGNATITSRPDVAAVYPNAPTNCGYWFPLDATRYAPGAHTVTAVVVSADGVRTNLPAVPVTIA